MTVPAEPEISAATILLLLSVQVPYPCPPERLTRRRWRQQRTLRCWRQAAARATTMQMAQLKATMTQRLTVQTLCGLLAKSAHYSWLHQKHQALVTMTAEQMCCKSLERRKPNEKTAVAPLQRSNSLLRQWTMGVVVRRITHGPKQASGRSPSGHQQVSLRPEHCWKTTKLFCSTSDQTCQPLQNLICTHTALFDALIVKSHCQRTRQSQTHFYIVVFVQHTRIPVSVRASDAFSTYRDQVCGCFAYKSQSIRIHMTGTLPQADPKTKARKIQKSSTTCRLADRNCSEHRRRRGRGWQS